LQRQGERASASRRASALRASGTDMPARSTRLRPWRWPDTRVTWAGFKPNNWAMYAVKALLALPSTGGAWMRIFRAPPWTPATWLAAAPGRAWTAMITPSLACCSSTCWSSTVMAFGFAVHPGQQGLPGPVQQFLGGVGEDGLARRRDGHPRRGRGGGFFLLLRLLQLLLRGRGCGRGSRCRGRGGRGIDRGSRGLPFDGGSGLPAAFSGVEFLQ